MPRTYDPDFDDTPPSSPKHGGFHNSPPTFQIRWRRYRSYIISALIFAGLLYFFIHRRRPLFRPKHTPSLTYKHVDWRQFAYSQYATDSANLCNAVMVFEALDRLGTKAAKILIYPEEMDTVVSNGRDRDSQLLVKARDWYGVQLIPVPIQAIIKTESATGDIEQEMENKGAWDKGITKFLAFNETRFTRIIHFDADVTVFRHMDELFLLPPAAIAMPRAYWWLPKHEFLTPSFMVIEPSEEEAARVMDEVDAESSSSGNFDTHILNRIYKDSALVLPHRRFALQASEFRAKDHTAYHGNTYENWDPDRALREASLVHFSDGPVPKPWIMWSANILNDVQPRCDYMSGTAQESGCRNREVWKGLYEDFRKRRKDICRILSVPPPPWTPLDPDADVRPPPP